jgi:endonuclease YncB( thermonuclease family)
VDWSCEKDPQTIKLKRKLGIDAPEKEGGKRKCVQPYSQVASSTLREVVPQNALDIPAFFYDYL